MAFKGSSLSKSISNIKPTFSPLRTQQGVFITHSLRLTMSHILQKITAKLFLNNICFVIFFCRNVLFAPQRKIFYFLLTFNQTLPSWRSFKGVIVWTISPNFSVRPPLTWCKNYRRVSGHSSPRPATSESCLDRFLTASSSLSFITVHVCGNNFIPHWNRA